MAEKFLNTRIKLKYDSYSNWTSNNPTLLDGEVAIAYIETPTSTQEVGSVDNSTSRQVLMKVGPGAYNSLQFITAKAADVHSWAKKTEAEFTEWVKSLVSVDDIDLSAYYTKTEIDSQVATLAGKDDNLQGQIDAIKNGEELDSFADVEAAVEEAVNGINNKIGTVAEGKTVVQMIADAQEAATYDDSEVKTLIGEDAGKSARTIANEELAKQLIPENAAATLNELQEIAAWIQAHPGDASAMNLAIQALEGKLTGIDTTVVAYVTSAIDALKIGDYAKASDLLLLTNRVSALEEDTHTHGNKGVLDGITSEGVASWNTASTTAATAVQTVTAGSGLKATRSGNEATIDFDPDVVFVFNCGDSTAV